LEGASRFLRKVAIAKRKYGRLRLVSYFKVNVLTLKLGMPREKEAALPKRRDAKTVETLLKLRKIEVLCSKSV
jgi:hypothetical protein